MPPASYSYFQSWQNEPRGRLFKGRKAENAALTRKASLFSPNNDQDVSGRSVDYGSNDLRLDPSLKAENIQIAPDLKNNQPIEARPDEDLKPKGFGGLFGGQGAKEPGIISKILQVGLPALTGLAGGVGILPGLLTGYAGMKAGEYKRQDDALDRQLKQDALNKPSETERLFQNYKGMSDEDRALYGQFQSLRQPTGLTPYQAAMLERGDRNEAAKGEKETKSTETGLRKEFISNPIFKNYQTAKVGMEKMENSMKNTEKTGFDDMALIFNYMHVLDPQSVVREGEFKTAENNASALEKMGIALNKIQTGERLTPAQRANLLNSARGQYNAQRSNFDSWGKEYQSLAKESGVTAKKVVKGWSPLPERVSPFYGKTKDINESNMDEGSRAALDWLYENPNDPDAPAVINILKRKAILR